MKLAAVLILGFLAFVAAVPAKADSAAFHALMNDAKWNLILQNTVRHGQCPSFVMLSGKKASAGFSKPGDVVVTLETYIPAVILNGSFPADSVNEIYVRPGLSAGVVHVLNSSHEFHRIGGSYSTVKQTEANDIIATERATYGLSVTSITHTLERISFNTRTNELIYHFANGRIEADCTFTK